MSYAVLYNIYSISPENSQFNLVYSGVMLVINLVQGEAVLTKYLDRKGLKKSTYISIYRLKYFCHFFKSLQSVYTITCSLMNRVIITSNIYKQAARLKVTTIIVHTFIKHEQRRKY